MSLSQPLRHAKLSRDHQREKMDSYIYWVASTMIFSLFGIPALSTPAGLTEDGLPVGLQIVGKRFAEATLTALAKEVQAQISIGSAPI